MKRYLLEKKSLPDFLKNLETSYAVFVPRKRADDFFFERNSAPQLDNYSNTASSVKEFFLPSREVIATISGETISEREGGNAKRIIFGVRPCDARALILLDRVFYWGDLIDPYYKRNRENTALFVLECIAPSATCFCTSVGTAPDDTTGADIFVKEQDEAFILEPVSEKGEKILKESGLQPETASREPKRRVDKGGKTKPQKLDLNIETLIGTLDKSFADNFWSEISETCIGCGVCAFLCPTCHCFDITDEIGKSGGIRVRSWDSCSSPLFTLHGSGHNPRPSQTERLRQRIMHKFNYTVKNFNDIFCVGCGRCVRKCPAGIDLRTVIEKISRH